MLEEAREFVYSQRVPVLKKITYNMQRVANGDKDPEIFKKLDGTDIWEFRTFYEGNTYRLFAFWDTESRTLIVATHGIMKKTQKTPKKEISKAERIKKDYFNNKSKGL